MSLAIEKAREGIDGGQTPFGACIVRDGNVVACAHNVVWRTTDVTAHAEVHALRLACEALGTIDLAGATLYSTCEPCPMCFAAAHWARIGTIYFGARIEDAAAFGFNELRISNETMKRESGSPVVLVPDFAREDCVELFRRWKARIESRPY
jgi:tRNA(Arg) A34 adenosine deaminase TadA